MTIYGRDASHYDASVSFAGLSFFTAKVTEGTNNPDAKYADHMAAARTSGVPVLGSYHVLRTPGSGGAGGLAQQLAYWVARQDAATPWWRTHPHWVMQIDAEKWQYDAVSSATVLAFAQLLAHSGLPGWKVTYASRGQYGDSLTGIRTPLWNAAYGSNSGSYPGDNAAGWTAYSGQVPVLLQYASKGYDHNAYRGSSDQLLALIANHQTEEIDMPQLSDTDYLALMQAADRINGSATAGLAQYPVRLKTGSATEVSKLESIRTALAGLATPTIDTVALAHDIATELIADNANGLTPADLDAVGARLKSVLDAKLTAAAAA